MDSVAQLYPGSLFPYAFEFRPGFGYAQSHTMTNGKGYWAKFGSSGTNTVSGGPLYVDSISVAEGWNLIGSVSTVVDTAAIVSTPSGIRTSDWFGYAGGYAPAAFIVPGKSYWVKAGTPGVFVLSSGPVGKRHVASEQRSDALSRLTITDAGYGNQSLFVVADDRAALAAGMAELPPPGPEGTFDARFESQRLCEVYPEAKERSEFPIIIRSARYPVTVSWDIRAGGKTTFRLRDGTGAGRFTPRQMSGTGKYTISDPAIQRLIVSVEPSEVPEDFVLLQNFPNPFNPSTTIQFGLPYDAMISLDLYDALGQHIATIEQGRREAGYHDVVVQNFGLSSGVYFYRLRAEGIVISRKLIVLK
jgi:hypothetical protein